MRKADGYRQFLWFCLAAILIFSPLARGAVRLWSVTPVLLAEAVLIFAWLFRANNTAGYNFRRTRIDAPFFIFLILACNSFAFSGYKRDSLYALLDIAGYIGLYYVIVNEFDKKMLKRLLLLTVILGSGLAAYGLLQYFGLLPHHWWNPKNFLAATYVNHNHFAGYLELVIPVAVGMILSNPIEKLTAKKVFLSAVIVIMSAGFILTQSRGAWISLGFSLVVMIVISTRRKVTGRHNMFFFLLTAFAIISLAYFGREIIFARVGAINGAKGIDISVTSRAEVWQGAVAMIAKHPIAGCGIGTFGWNFVRFRPRALDMWVDFAHNDYLQMASEMGIIAAIIFIWIIILIVRSAVRHANDDPVKFGCGMGILSLALHNVVDFNFHIPANMLLFIVLAAAIMGGRSLEEDGG